MEPLKKRRRIGKKENRDTIEECMEFLCKLRITDFTKESKSVKTEEDHERVDSCKNKVFSGINRNKKLRCPTDLEGKRSGKYELYTPQRAQPVGAQPQRAQPVGAQPQEARPQLHLLQGQSPFQINQKPKFRLKHTLYGCGGVINKVAFSAVGKLIASGNSKGTLCVWDIKQRDVPKLKLKLVGNKEHEREK